MKVYCEECKKEHKPTDMFRVRHMVWKQSKAKEILCLSCLELRINRKLTPKDFTKAEINFANDILRRLKNRKVYK